jgi:hypothetical protein
MATTSVTTGKAAQAERVDFRKLAWVGPLAVAGSVVLNIIVREVAALLGAIPQSQPVTQLLPVILSTVVQVGLGVGVFALMGKMAKRPISTFRLVGIFALIFSLTNPIMAATGMFPLPFAAEWNVSIVLTMMVMHIVAGVFTIWLLTTQAREA